MVCSQSSDRRHVFKFGPAQCAKTVTTSRSREEHEIEIGIPPPTTTTTRRTTLRLVKKVRLPNKKNGVVSA